MVALCAVALTPASAQHAQVDPIVQGFVDPPSSARPFVWWHWLNGNVTERGIDADLAWMQRVGVGGVQVFEAQLATPRVINPPVLIGTPQWAWLLRHAGDTARQRGIEFGVTSSAGWSIAGAPWVRPEQAMKKLVWSSTVLSGGGERVLTLAPPPHTPGPYQDIAAADAPASEFYRDIAVLAVRARDELPPPARVEIGEASTVEAGILLDAQFGRTLDLPQNTDGAVTITYTFSRAVTVRSVEAGIGARRGFGAPVPPHARLESSNNGRTFTRVIDLEATAPVRTATFNPIRARYFRLVIERPTGPGFAQSLHWARGARQIQFPDAPSTFSVTEFALHSRARVSRALEQAGFGIVEDYARATTPPSADATAVHLRDIIDVSRFVDANGVLRWRAPAGRWRILRLGYSLTGKVNGPAPPESTGLEVDKLNAVHARAYFSRHLQQYRALWMNTDSTPIANLLLDSIESGPQNWTDDMLEQFERRRGYSALLYLPALAGEIVGSVEASERFLWDFRRTIADLTAEGFYGAAREVAEEHNAALYAEALEDHRPQLGDDLAMRRYAHVPMAAMWTIPDGDQPRATYIADAQGAASVANFHGQQLVAAESLSAFGAPWAQAPSDLRRTLDLEFALGVNRIVIHSSAHQYDESHPGVALAPTLGQYFNRHETWAELAGPFVRYIARSSFLLQQGRRVTDIAYFVGEDAPVTATFGDAEQTEIPRGYGFDFIGPGELQLLTVDDGRLRSPGGASYRVLYLRYGPLTIESLRALQRLTAQGAVIVGQPPSRSPSWSDSTDEFTRLRNALWRRGETSVRAIPLGSALDQLSIAPDWSTTGADGALRVAHRELPGRHVYFITNQTGEAVRTELSVHAAGHAQIWRADDGSISEAPCRAAGDLTVIPLVLHRHDAFFVVVSNGVCAPPNTPAAPSATHVVNGPWALRFEPGRGGPTTLVLSELSSLSSSNDPRVRYFSGRVTYSARVALPHRRTGQRLVLDLGQVGDVARVRINGRDAGVVWMRWHTLDISDSARPGMNAIEIEVANMWVNRLIGDAQPNALRVTSFTEPLYEANAPLRPSGLIGPVFIREQRIQ